MARLVVAGCRSCASIFALVLTAPLAASTGSWIAIGGGDFADRASWVGGVPGPLDAAIFGAITTPVPFMVTGVGPFTVSDLHVWNQSPEFAFSGRSPSLAVSTDFEFIPNAAAQTVTLAGTNLSVGGSTTISGAAGVASLVLTTGSGAAFHNLTLGEAGGQGSISVANSTLTLGGSGSECHVGFQGQGTITLNAGAVLDLQGATVELGRFQGEGVLNVNAGAIAKLGGGSVRVGAYDGPANEAGNGKLTVGGTIEGVGSVAVGWALGSVGTLECIAGAVIEPPVTLGIGSATLACSGSTTLGSVTLATLPPGGFFTSGPGTAVTANVLAFNGDSQTKFSVCCGSSFTTPTLSLENGSANIAAQFGGTLHVSKQIVATSLRPAGVQMEASGAGSSVSLPSIETVSGGPLTLRAINGGAMSIGALLAPESSKVTVLSNISAHIDVTGDVSLLGAPATGQAAALSIGANSTLHCAALTTGPTAPTSWTLPCAPVPITATTATLNGPIVIGGPSPSMPGDIRLIDSPSVALNPSSVSLGVYFGYPPVLVVDDSGLILRTIDHVDSLAVQPILQLKIGESLQVHVTAVIAGEPVDVSASSTWEFAAPLVVQSGPTTLFGIAAGETIATVRFGAASTTTTIIVDQVAVPALTLISGTPLEFGDRDSGAGTPELYYTVLGIRPRGISADGFVVAFSSAATNLVAGGGGLDNWNVLVKDLNTQVFERLSNTEGEGLNHADTGASMSRDGRFVVFEAVPTPGERKRVFLTDRTSGATTFADLTNEGNDPNGNCAAPRVSNDGRYVLFESVATNLVAGDTNGKRDVFLRDRELGTTTRVSLSATAGQLSVNSFVADLSTDGRYALFLRKTAGWTLAHRYDRLTGEIVLATPGFDDPLPQVNVLSAQLSDDGRYVAFISTGLSGMTDLPAESTAQLYRRDMLAGETIAASLSESGAWASAPIEAFALSGDARFALFTTKAMNLLSEPQGTSFTRAFRKDVVTGATDLVSTGALGDWNANVDAALALNYDGSRGVLATAASNVLPGDTNGHHDVFGIAFGAPVLGDLDGDGIVGPSDLGLLLGAWGTSRFDLDGDGAVGASDLAILLGAWT